MTTQWVKCSDKPPLYNAEVLITTVYDREGDVPLVGVYVGNSWVTTEWDEVVGCFTTQRYSSQDVVAWMPKPNVYYDGETEWKCVN